LTTFTPPSNKKFEGVLFSYTFFVGKYADNILIKIFINYYIIQTIEILFREALKRMKRISVFLICIFLVGTYFFPHIGSDEPEKSDWWNNNWFYCKTLFIDNPINDYQMFVNVTKTIGGDVNCSGHCNDDFSDIRFIDIDNTTLLDYWMEKKVDGDYAWFWVELSSDVETDGKIVLYFGNSLSSSLSDGNSTFLWFDDFSANTSGEWQIISDEWGIDWNCYNTKFDTVLNSARIRSNVDCIDLDSRNFAGAIAHGMKYENNTDAYNLSMLRHWYNSDWGASETQTSIQLLCVNNSDGTYPFPGNGMSEGINGYVTEWTHSYTQSIARGKLWDSSNTLIWDEQVTTNIRDNLRYLCFRLKDYHGINGGGSETGIFYDSEDEQLILYCKGSYYSPTDSWMELHYNWMFLGIYNEDEPIISNVGNEKSHLDLIAYWHFDEGSGTVAYDSSGNNNHGTVYGASWVTGKNHTGLEFIDTDIVRHIPASFDNTITDSFTIECWIYWYGEHPWTPSHSSYIFDARTGTSINGRGFNFGISGDKRLSLNLLTPSGTKVFVGSATIPTNEWTHVKGIFDSISNTRSLFINGLLDNTTSYFLPYYDTSLTAAIGNNRWAPGDGQWAPFNGIIDELMINNETFDLQPPEANFTYTPMEPTGNDVISFTDTSYDSDGVILSWWWDFGDGYYSDLQHPIHCYYQDGTYEVSLTVTDDHGATDTITKQITVITEVLIDIKPGFYPNNVNPSSKGKLPVAVLTTNDFDAASIDTSSILFLDTVPVGWMMDDVDNDTDDDLLLKFKIQDLNFSLLVDEGDDYPYAYLTGETTSGTQFVGMDTIRLVGPIT
jgi:PKD repeat protein